MKSIILLIAMALATVNTRAGEPLNNAPAKSDRLKSQLNRHVVFPSSTPAYGEVEVVFKVTERGEVEVLETRSLNEQLSDYVAKKLEKVRLTKDDISLGQVIRYRFVFKKQD